MSNNDALNHGAQVEGLEDWNTKMRQGLAPEPFIQYVATTMVPGFREQVIKAAQIAGTEPEINELPVDIAMSLLVYLESGLITEQDIEAVLQHPENLGLTNEQSRVFLSETLPNVQAFLQKEQERKEIEGAEAFCVQWDITRLDDIHAFNIAHLTEIIATSQTWALAVQGYSAMRTQLVAELQAQTDPRQRIPLLMRAVQQLTLLRPSELDQVYRAERNEMLRVDHGSLLRVGKAILEQDLGLADPDADAARISTGNIGVTVRFYRADDPESAKAMQREQLIESLGFVDDVSPDILSRMSPFTRGTLKYPLNRGGMAMMDRQG